jgi:hypothetical protein
MYPNQPNQNGYPPQQPTPAGPAPLQQAPNGQYSVLPPLNNTGGASGHNPYEFIMSPNSKKHGLRHGSFGKQLAFIGSGAVVLIIILAIAFSMFAPKGNTASVLAVAQRQQEIIRIADSSSRLINSQSIRNFVITTDVTVITDQGKVLTYLATRNVKPKGKTLALDHDAKTDDLIASAKAAGNYDTIIAQTLQDQLSSYEKELKTAYNDSTSASTKKMLQQNYTNAQTLLKQANSVVVTTTTSDSAN